MRSRAPKGTQDLLFEAAGAWSLMQQVADAVFGSYGYGRVDTPMFEQVDVFVHGIGTSTDVVSKEMFTVLSPDAYEKVASGSAETLKNDQRLALRPEATAGFVRAAIEHNLLPQGGAPVKAWYAGSMFRAERPQRGRLREFRQIGAECLGSTDPLVDAEMIAMAVRFFDELGFDRENVTLLVNSMGDDACRPAYRDSVRDYILDHVGDLCATCNTRAETNPLRAFDCKNPDCKQVMEGAPRITDVLCDDCKEHHAHVLAYLDILGIEYTEDARLVRGLDYYTRTVFEFQTDAGLGSQNALGGGGRYDKLMSIVGGRDEPGIGFALGFDRILLALEAQDVPLSAELGSDVFVAQVDGSTAQRALVLMEELRDAGLAVESDVQSRSLKSQFKLAGKKEVPFVVVLGPDELESGNVTLRDMEAGEERSVPREELAETILRAFMDRAGLEELE